MVYRIPHIAVTYRTSTADLVAEKDKMENLDFGSKMGVMKSWLTVDRNYGDNVLDEVGFVGNMVEFQEVRKGIVVTRNPFVRLYQVWSHAFITSSHDHSKYYGTQLEFMKNMVFEENSTNIPENYSSFKNLI